MIIKPATIYDLDGIFDCAKRFFEYAGFEKQGFPLCEDSFKKTVLRDIETDSGIVLLLKDGPYGQVKGGIAGTVAPWWMNFEISILIERFFWIDEDCRGMSAFKMLRKFEQAGARLGATKTVMISVDAKLTEKINKLYTHCGYKPFENFYIKDTHVS